MKENYDVSHYDEDAMIDARVVDVYDEEFLDFLVGACQVSSSVIERLQSSYTTVLLVVDLFVVREKRRHRIGATVIARTIESAKALGAEAALFILDHQHENDFDLYGWTLRRGYRLLEQTPHGPIMIRDL